jgi:formylmethanofuran dehydrogenase subunit E
MEIPEKLKRAREFHGHLGPWLVLGIRIGEDAVSALNARRFFGLKVHVKAPEQPPPSCIVDGLQLSTGCTYGKRNIELQPSEQVEVLITNTDTNQARTYRVEDWFLAEARRRIQEEGEDAASLWAWETDGLFRVLNAEGG